MLSSFTPYINIQHLHLGTSEREKEENAKMATFLLKLPDREKGKVKNLAQFFAGEIIILC